MAGKRQHYLPRFLLRGFSSKTEGEKSFVWYFRKGIDPKEISIRDVALSKSFYGASGIGTLDETITESEQKFGPVIDRLRKEVRVTTKDLPTVIDLVVNIVIRNRYIRKTLTDAAGELFEMVGRNISDPQKMANFLIDAFKKDKSEFRERLRSSIRSELSINSPMIEELIIKRVEENAEDLIQLTSAPFSDAIVKGISKFLTKIEDQGAKSHKEGLEKFFQENEPSIRHRSYSELHWLVKRYNSNDFILGDIGIIEMEVNSRKFCPPFYKKKVDYVVLFPISHDTLLFGSSTKQLSLPKPDVLNSASVEMSTDFFVSSVNKDRERLYSKKIGSRSTWWDDEINEIERNTFGNL